MTVSPLFAADKYTYRLLWSEDQARYVGVCSEFPNLRYEATGKNDALFGIQNRVAEEIAQLSR